MISIAVTSEQNQSHPIDLPFVESLFVSFFQRKGEGWALSSVYDFIHSRKCLLFVVVWIMERIPAWPLCHDGAASVPWQRMIVRFTNALTWNFRSCYAPTYTPVPIQINCNARFSTNNWNLTAKKQTAKNPKPPCVKWPGLCDCKEMCRETLVL